MLIRRFLTPVVALSLTVGGFAYAAVDDEAPVDSVQNTAEDVPETVVDDEPTESPEGDDDADAPTLDDVTPDVGTVTDVVDDAALADETESHGPERSTEGCPEGFSGNHGQYVSGTEERPRKDAAHSECGKPVHEDDESGDDDSAPEEVPGS